MDFDFIQYIWDQRLFSYVTFGPGSRTEGIVDHIRKELKEIEKNPLDLMEWTDIMILALDGAWRAGYTPREIAQALEQKAKINRERKWPDWRTVPEGKAIEHVRDDEAG